MRKLIITAVSLVALAAIVVPFANAATTDANGVVTVSKGELMAQFPSMNESAFQNGPKVLTGSNVFTATTTTGTGCSDGTIQYHERNTVITTPINFAPIVNAANGKTTSWTMTKGASVLSENNTYGTSPSGRFPNYATICEGHGSISAFNAVFTQTHSDVTTTTFNGAPVSIAVTPYVAPAV